LLFYAHQDVAMGLKLNGWLSRLKQLLVKIELFPTNKSFLHDPLTLSCMGGITGSATGEGSALFGPIEVTGARTDRS